MSDDLFESIASKLRGLAKPLLDTTFAVIIGLLVGALLMWLYGYNPWNAYYYLFKGGFGSLKGIFETLSFATPLMLTGITWLVGWKSGIFNIGAEGQMYMGAIGAVWIGGTAALPAGIHVAAATIVGMLFGLLWALPVAALKVWRGAHEVVTTIMLNWIALFFVRYLIRYQVPMPGNAYRTVPAMETARFPLISEGTTLTAAVFVAIAFCVGIFIFLWRTRLGYEFRLTGANPEAARYAGIDTQRIIFLNLLIGGLAAGLAGSTQVLGRPPVWGLYETLGGVYGLGFTGIGVGIIGRNHPIGAILAAFFYGGLLHGGTKMMAQAGVAGEMMVAIQGLIILAVALPVILPMIREKIASWRG